MAKPIIWHNPKCSKSRETLNLLRDKGIEPEVRLYLEDTPSVSDLKAVLIALKLKPRDIIRKTEILYKSLNLSEEAYSDAALIKILHEHPILIERPIVIVGKKAKIGRPAENVLSILKK